MGLLDKLFGFTKINYVYAGSSSRSAPFNKEAYQQEIVRSVIDAIATHAAKAEALHVVLDRDGRVKDIKRNSPYVKLLNQSPNPLMTGYDLKYKVGCPCPRPDNGDVLHQVERNHTGNDDSDSIQQL